LVTVSLADNLISDLQELAACSKLQCLDISSNLVSEVCVHVLNVAQGGRVPS
jgi:Leucine-rich repeat (LRR) protein